MDSISKINSVVVKTLNQFDAPLVMVFFNLNTVSAVKTEISKIKIATKNGCFFLIFFPCVAPVLFHNWMEFQLVLTIFYHQKLLFRKSSFHHLAKCFLAMLAVIPSSWLLPPWISWKEVGEESNTDNQTDEDEDDPYLSGRRGVVFPASCLLPPWTSWRRS